jgi:hypothetical protein
VKGHLGMGVGSPELIQRTIRRSPCSPRCPDNDTIAASDVTETVLSWVRSRPPRNISALHVGLDPRHLIRVAKCFLRDFECRNRYFHAPVEIEWNASSGLPTYADASRLAAL